MANPEVAPMIHVYPEDVHGSPISEMWQVPNGRWLELPLDFLTPSILINNKRHYIHEVAQLQDLRWIIPKKWVVQAGKIYADAHLVRRNSQVSPRHPWNPDIYYIYQSLDHRLFSQLI